MRHIRLTTRLLTPLAALVLPGGCKDAPATGPGRHSPVPAVASVTVNPAALSLVAGEARQLTATAYDAAGSVLTGSTITWSSSDTAVTTVAATGLVHAKKRGSTAVTASVEGKNGSAAITVVDVANSGGAITADFRGCGGPLWFAYQDGDGPWTPVTGNGGLYTFDITSSRGGIAFVFGPFQATPSMLGVDYRTRAEFTAQPLTFCSLAPIETGPGGVPIPSGAVIAFGSVTGIDATQGATVSLGGGTAQVAFANPHFSLYSAAGTHDLIGYRYSLVGAVGQERMILRRDQDVEADDHFVAPLDFASAEAFAPDSATITVGGLLAGEVLTRTIRYLLGTACTSASLGDQVVGASARVTAYGIPVAQQRAGDFHAVTLRAETAITGGREVTESFHTLADRTVTLPEPISTPTITSLAEPYGLRVEYALPPNYGAASTWMRMYLASGNIINVNATSGYLGGAAVTHLFPDLSLASLQGRGSAISGSWAMTVRGVSSALPSGQLCAEGARSTFAWLSGAF